jgi:hypothetical protein
MSEQDWISESLATIRNLTDLAIEQRENGMEISHRSKLATLIELIFLEAQHLTDEQCVVKDGD